MNETTDIAQTLANRITPEAAAILLAFSYKSEASSNRNQTQTEVDTIKAQCLEKLEELQRNAVLIEDDNNRLRCVIANCNQTLTDQLGEEGRDITLEARVLAAALGAKQWLTRPRTIRVPKAGDVVRVARMDNPKSDEMLHKSVAVGDQFTIQTTTTIATTYWNNETGAAHWSASMENKSGWINIPLEWLEIVE